MSRQPSRPRSETGSRPAEDEHPASNAEPVRSATPAASTLSPPSRRRLLASAGTAGVLATSGCLSTLGSSGESNADAGLTLDRLGFADGFGEEADSLAEVYGEHGVWGLADGPGVDGPTYVGAYRDSLAVPGGDETGGAGGGDPWVAADLAAVAYRLDGGAYRGWLWAGARARQPDGGLGRSSVTRVSVGATAGDGWTLVGFAPRGSFRAGPVTVSLDDRGPAGRTPLPGGGIGTEDGARTGPNGQFEVAWQGIARGIRSVNAVCEVRPTEDGADDRPVGIFASFGVAGGRGAF